MKRCVLLLILCCCSIEWMMGQAIDQLDVNKGLQLSGSITTSNIGYLTSGVKRRDPFSSYLSGNLNLNLFGYSMPFTFSYSNRQASYTQPFNQFRFAPSYKWVKLYIGTANMSFSNYTLSGHLFNGVGVELTPGKWEVAAMYGRMKKAVQPSLDQQSYIEPSYKRMGYGLKVGYSDTWGRVGVNIFSARDDANSLKMVTPEMQIEPLGNVAVGLNARKTFLKRFYADVEYAFSVVNRLDNPLVSIDTLDISEKDNATSRRFNAINTAVGYQGDIFALALRYERVAPGYRTLGAYYFNNDMQNITIAPSVRLLKGTLQLSANVGIQQDNLDKKKEATTKRWVGSLNAAYNPNEHWNLAASYSNFNTYTKYRMTDDPYFRDELDSLNFYQVSQTLTGSAGYSFGEKDYKHTITGFLSYQQSKDQQDANPAAGTTNLYSSNASYTYSIIPRSISFTLGANYNLNEGPGLRTTFVGPSVNVAKGMLKNQLKASAGGTYNYSNTEAETVKKDFSTVNGRFNLTYSTKGDKNATLGHHAGLTLNYLQRIASAPDKGYNEWTITVNYTMSFK